MEKGRTDQGPQDLRDDPGGSSLVICFLLVSFVLGVWFFVFCFPSIYASLGTRAACNLELPMGANTTSEGQPALSGPLVGLEDSSPVGWSPSGYTHCTPGKQDKKPSLSPSPPDPSETGRESPTDRLCSALLTSRRHILSTRYSASPTP